MPVETEKIPISIDNPLVLRLQTRDALSTLEREVLANAFTRVKTLAAHEEIIQQGHHATESTLVLEGFACRYSLLGDGKRQITAVHVMGDFVDLHSFLLKTMDHGVEALSACRIAVVPHETLTEITERHPHLTRLLWLSTLLDAAIYREWLVSMGRKPALSQLAHLLCELFLRLKTVGQTDGFRFRLPLTQEDLADTLGLTPVHTNRVLQELRRDGLVAWRGQQVEILRWDDLAAVAEFDDTYLHLHPEPR